MCSCIHIIWNKLVLLPMFLMSAVYLLTYMRVFHIGHSTPANSEGCSDNCNLGAYCGWRPFSQLSFAQPRSACPWVRVVKSGLFPSALGGQCWVRSAVPLSAVTPQCGVRSAVLEVHRPMPHRLLSIPLRGLGHKQKAVLINNGHDLVLVAHFITSRH